MKAAVLTAPRTIRVQRQEIRAVSPHSALVRVQGCGVCGSNLPVWEGRPWFRYPLSPGAPGHEGWGIVEQTGDAVTGLKAGDRVAMLSQHAFAEYETAPADTLVRLPASFDRQPFPGEAIGCAMNVFRRSDIQPGQTVAIIGIGFLGALLTNLAARAGAEIIAVSRRPFALQIAEKMGAKFCLPLKERAPTAMEINAVTGNVGCDRVIEVTGHQEPLDLAGDVTRERGRLIVAGYHQDGLRTVNMQQWNWRGIDVINAHERDSQLYIRGIQEGVEAVASGRLDPSPLYTHSFPLEQLSDALESMRRRPSDFLKALISCP